MEIEMLHIYIIKVSLVIPIQPFQPSMKAPVSLLKMTGHVKRDIRSAVQCSAEQCTAVHCSVEQCSAVQCSEVQSSAVQCSVEQCRAPLHFNKARCCRRRSRDQTSQPTGAWPSRIYWRELMEKQIPINKKINRSIYHFNEQNFSWKYFLTYKRRREWGGKRLKEI